MLEIEGFFYKNDYYLFPAEAHDLLGFIRLLILSGGKAEVTKLDQNECCPPSFVDSRMTSCVLENVDPRRVFRAKIFLYGRNEYDAKLRKCIDGKCGKCWRFGADSKALSEYYCETPLDRECADFLDEAQFREFDGLSVGYEPYFSVDDFWNDFMLASSKLIGRIDRGDLAGAMADVNKMITDADFNDYIFPALSKFSYHDVSGREVVRYVLMLTGGGFICSDLISSYFARLMPAKLGKKWDVFPYAVRGLFNYQPGITCPDVGSEPPLLRATYLEQQDCFQLYAFVTWDAEKVAALAPPGIAAAETFDQEEVPGIVYCANYLYLCSVIGEERLRGACLEVVMFPASELVPDAGTVTPEEFDRLIDLQIRDRAKLLPESDMRSMELESVSELRDVSRVKTRADQLTFDLLLGGDNALSYMWERCIATGVIHFPAELDPDTVEYLRSRIAEDLESGGLAQIFDVCTGEDGTFFDLLVWDKFMTKRTLRRLAPAYAAYGGRLILRMGSETEEELL